MLYFCFFLMAVVVILICRIVYQECHIRDMRVFIGMQRDSNKFYIERYNTAVTALHKKDQVPILTDKP